MTPGGNQPPVESIWPEALLQALPAPPEAGRLWVAFSGGLDSSLLLAAAAQRYSGPDFGRLHGIHINHQLQSSASAMEEHCRNVCDSLGIPLMVERVVPSGGKSLEQAARKARYDVFEQVLAPGDLLLMAHHGDDQVETVLFRLVRGTGLTGLQGIPAARPLGQGTLCRPLLEYSRDQLHQWAQAANLEWIEDPSNQSPTFDRNYLRHRVLPVLRERWPNLIGRVGHTVAALRDQVHLSRKLAQLQSAGIQTDDGSLLLAELALLPAVERHNLVYWWLRGQGLRPPPRAKLEQALDDFCSAGEDRQPELAEVSYCLRRHQGRLVVVAAAEPVPESPQWLTAERPLYWGEACYELQAVGPEREPPQLLAKKRHGGERLPASGGRPGRPLKKWLQETGLSPWQRQRLALFYEGDQLVGIDDIWRHERFSDVTPSSGWRIQRRKTD